VVEVTDRDQLGWHVPESVYSTHRDYAADEGYKSHARAVEDAMREFIDADDLAGVEHRVDDILDALPSNDGAKKTGRSLDGHTTSGETRKVNCRVDADLKAEFARHVREEFDTRPGVALGYALQEHHDTGSRNRRQRIHDKLDAIQTTVEGMEATGRDKVDAIADQLGESFRLREFLDAAETVGVTTEKYAVEKYLPDVLDRTETVPHPGNPRVFIPRSSDTAPSNPNPANLPYYMMTDDDKRVGIQVAAVRKAWSNGGRARLTVEEGVDALAGVGSPRHKTVRAAMREAGEYDGFDYDDRETVLRVNQDGFDNARLADVLPIADEERAADRNSPDDLDGDPDERDANPGVEADKAGETDPETDAQAEMDALAAATPVRSDGGEDGGPAR
jgi:hypothetical protein